MGQLNLFNSTNSPGELVTIQDGEYLFIPDYFNKIESDHYFNSLLQGIEWRQEEMNIYGRVVKFPRLTAWYGDSDRPYSFSGITLSPNKWNEDLLAIKNKIGHVCKSPFNSVLLNLYRNGNDSISWHTDAEKELGENPVIASANFGGTRKFQLKHIYTKKVIEIELSHGSLLIMQGKLQHFWQHQVPKTKLAVKQRINLTFRLIR